MCVCVCGCVCVCVCVGVCVCVCVCNMTEGCLILLQAEINFLRPAGQAEVTCVPPPNRPQQEACD